VSCPLSSISLVWSHAAGLPVDYLSGLVEIRNDCPSREVEAATMAINIRDMEASFCFVCHSRPCVMPVVQHQSRVVSRRRTTCGLPDRLKYDCPSREVEEATMAINVRDMEASFCFVCQSGPCVMPIVQHQSRVVSRHRTTCGLPEWIG